MQIILLILTRVFSPMDALTSPVDGNRFWVDCNVPRIYVQYESRSADNTSTTTTTYPFGSLSRLDSSIWVYVALVVYNIIALICGVYLTIVTRNVDKRFNESNVMAIAIYNIVVCAILFFLSISSNNPNNKLARVIVLAYAVCSTILVMVGPKFKHIFCRKRRRGPMSVGGGGDDDDDDDHGDGTHGSRKFVSFDALTLKQQALEREENYTKTMTIQQEQLATLVQYILTTERSDEKESVLKLFENQHQRHINTIEDEAALTKRVNEQVVVASPSMLSLGTPTSPVANKRSGNGAVVSSRSADVQQIIDLYQCHPVKGSSGLELSDVSSGDHQSVGGYSSTMASSQLYKSSTSMTSTKQLETAGTASASRSTCKGSKNSDNLPLDQNGQVDQAELRRQRLKSTFKYSALSSTARSNTLTQSTRSVFSNSSDVSGSIGSSPVNSTTKGSSGDGKGDEGGKKDGSDQAGLTAEAKLQGIGDSLLSEVMCNDYQVQNEPVGTTNLDELI
jgi:hypothetical protein